MRETEESNRILKPLDSSGQAFWRGIFSESCFLSFSPLPLLPLSLPMVRWIAVYKSIKWRKTEEILTEVVETRLPACQGVLHMPGVNLAPSLRPAPRSPHFPLRRRGCLAQLFPRFPPPFPHAKGFVHSFMYSLPLFAIHFYSTSFVSRCSLPTISTGASLHVLCRSAACTLCSSLAVPLLFSLSGWWVVHAVNMLKLFWNQNCLM